MSFSVPFSRIRVRGLVLIVVAALLPAGRAAAAPYWVAWEGNDYPENEGWTREGDVTKPTRSLNEGQMTLDSLGSERSEDFYRMYDIEDPEPGEEFVIQWRLRVHAVDWDNPNFPYDPGVAVYSADGWQAGLAFGESVAEHFESQAEIATEPGVLHSWEFRSSDMRAFSLRCDGSPIYFGSFVPSGSAGRVSWGDLVRGPTSRVDWDYFRFGVVPDPATGSCVFVLALFSTPRRQT